MVRLEEDQGIHVDRGQLAVVELRRPRLLALVVAPAGSKALAQRKLGDLAKLYAHPALILNGATDEVQQREVFRHKPLEGLQTTLKLRGE